MKRTLEQEIHESESEADIQARVDDILTQQLQPIETKRREQARQRLIEHGRAYVTRELASEEDLDARERMSIERDVKRDLEEGVKAAGLPLHFTPHGLRHSFASLLLQMGVSPAYVQRQLGHHSIKLTVDVYGRWLPMGNTAIVDRLDGASGSKMVAAGGGPEGEGAGILDLSDTSREGGRVAQLTSS